jgi:rhomboid family GlyGly-CTERM serine protease
MMWNAVRANAVFLFSVLLAVLLLLLCLPGSEGWSVDWSQHASSAYWQNYRAHLEYLGTRTPSNIDDLAFERVPLAAGQYWRLITGHFIHLNLHHALMNSAGLVMLGLYFRRDFSLPAWIGLILLSSLTISLGLWWTQPGLVAYVGFSGVLHALLYAGILLSWKEMPRINAVVMLLLVARLAWEHSPAYDPAYLAGWIHGLVAPAAHFFGALTGLAWGLVCLYRQRVAHSEPATPADQTS